MTAEPERALLARARDLADTGDLAEDVTMVLGSARAARLDPEALTGLAGAAVALGAGSLAVYRATGKPFAGDQQFAVATEDAEAEIAARAAATGRALTRARAAREAARDALGEARDALDRARAMPVSRPCDGCHGERGAAISAARTAITDARERVRYASDAVAELDPLAARLVRAVACIRRVLPDLADVYQPVYDHVQAGRLMPKDGDWLTGSPP